MTKIKVAIKLRPLIDKEIAKGKSVYWDTSPNTIFEIDPSTEKSRHVSYCFDHVFGVDSTNIHVYNTAVQPLVERVVDGFNATVFAYGQTSSGKTFTMLGDKTQPGIIPLTISSMFKTMEQSAGRQFLVRASYMEIYNEQINDLLAKKENLMLREDEGKVVVVDLKEEVVASVEKVMALIKKGERNRRIGETNMNERSSRSHTIFRLIVESRDGHSTDEDDQVIKVAHLNLVDLAGSERATQTGNKVGGERFKEGCAINRSLFMLSLVIQKLSDGSESFINYRNSKLTRILQSSLGGNALTVIICAVTAASLEETHSTLGFASRARNIKNKPEVNEVMSDGTLLKQYASQIKKLKSEMEKLKGTGVSVEEMESKLLEKDQMNSVLQERIDRLSELLIGYSESGTSLEASRNKRRMTWCAPQHRRYSLKPFQLSFEKICAGNMSSNDIQINDEDFCKIPFEQFEKDLLEEEMGLQDNPLQKTSDLSSGFLNLKSSQHFELPFSPIFEEKETIKYNPSEHCGTQTEELVKSTRDFGTQVEIMCYLNPDRGIIEILDTPPHPNSKSVESSFDSIKSYDRIEKQLSLEEVKQYDCSTDYLTRIDEELVEYLYRNGRDTNIDLKKKLPRFIPKLKSHLNALECENKKLSNVAESNIEIIDSSRKELVKEISSLSPAFDCSSALDLGISELVQTLLTCIMEKEKEIILHYESLNTEFKDSVEFQEKNIKYLEQKVADLQNELKVNHDMKYKLYDEFSSKNKLDTNLDSEYDTLNEQLSDTAHCNAEFKEKPECLVKCSLSKPEMMFANELVNEKLEMQSIIKQCVLLERELSRFHAEMKCKHISLLEDGKNSEMINDIENSVVDDSSPETDNLNNTQLLLLNRELLQFRKNVFSYKNICDKLHEENKILKSILTSVDSEVIKSQQIIFANNSFQQESQFDNEKENILNSTTVVPKLIPEVRGERDALFYTKEEYCILLEKCKTLEKNFILFQNKNNTLSISSSNHAENFVSGEYCLQEECQTEKLKLHDTELIFLKEEMNLSMNITKDYQCISEKLKTVPERNNILKMAHDVQNLEMCNINRTSEMGVSSSNLMDTKVFETFENEELLFHYSELKENLQQKEIELSNANKEISCLIEKCKLLEDELNQLRNIANDYQCIYDKLKTLQEDNDNLRITDKAEMDSNNLISKLAGNSSPHIIEIEGVLHHYSKLKEDHKKKDAELSKANEEIGYLMEKCKTLDEFLAELQNKNALPISNSNNREHSVDYSLEKDNLQEKLNDQNKELICLQKELNQLRNIAEDYQKIEMEGLLLHYSELKEELQKKENELSNAKEIINLLEKWRPLADNSELQTKNVLAMSQAYCAHSLDNCLENEKTEQNLTLQVNESIYHKYDLNQLSNAAKHYQCVTVKPITLQEETNTLKIPLEVENVLLHYPLLKEDLQKKENELSNANEEIRNLVVKCKMLEEKLTEYQNKNVLSIYNLNCYEHSVDNFSEGEHLEQKLKQQDEELICHKEELNQLRNISEDDQCISGKLNTLPEEYGTHKTEHSYNKAQTDYNNVMSDLLINSLNNIVMATHPMIESESTLPNYAELKDDSQNKDIELSNACEQIRNVAEKCNSLEENLADFRNTHVLSITGVNYNEHILNNSSEKDALEEKLKLQNEELINLKEELNQLRNIVKDCGNDTEKFKIQKEENDILKRGHGAQLEDSNKMSGVTVTSSDLFEITTAPKIGVEYDLSHFCELKENLLKRENELSSANEEIKYLLEKCETLESNLLDLQKKSKLLVSESNCEYSVVIKDCVSSNLETHCSGDCVSDLKLKMKVFADDKVRHLEEEVKQLKLKLTTTELKLSTVTDSLDECKLKYSSDYSNLIKQISHLENEKQVLLSKCSETDHLREELQLRDDELKILKENIICLLYKCCKLNEKLKSSFTDDNFKWSTSVDNDKENETQFYVYKDEQEIFGQFSGSEGISANWLDIDKDLIGGKLKSLVRQQDTFTVKCNSIIKIVSSLQNTIAIINQKYDSDIQHLLKKIKILEEERDQLIRNSSETDCLKKELLLKSNNLKVVEEKMQKLESVNVDYDLLSYKLQRVECERNDLILKVNKYETKICEMNEKFSNLELCYNNEVDSIHEKIGALEKEKGQLINHCNETDCLKLELQKKHSELVSARCEISHLKQLACEIDILRKSLQIAENDNLCLQTKLQTNENVMASLQSNIYDLEVSHKNEIAILEQKIKTLEYDQSAFCLPSVLNHNCTNNEIPCNKLVDKMSITEIQAYSVELDRLRNEISNFVTFHANKVKYLCEKIFHLENKPLLPTGETERHLISDKEEEMAKQNTKQVEMSEQLLHNMTDDKRAIMMELKMELMCGKELHLYNNEISLLQSKIKQPGEYENCHCTHTGLDSIPISKLKITEIGSTQSDYGISQISSDKNKHLMMPNCENDFVPSDVKNAGPEMTRIIEAVETEHDQEILNSFYSDKIFCLCEKLCNFLEESENTSIHSVNSKLAFIENIIEKCNEYKPDIRYVKSTAVVATQTSDNEIFSEMARQNLKYTESNTEFRTNFVVNSSDVFGPKSQVSTIESAKLKDCTITPGSESENTVSTIGNGDSCNNNLFSKELASLKFENEQLRFETEKLNTCISNKDQRIEKLQKVISSLEEDLRKCTLNCNIFRNVDIESNAANQSHLGDGQLVAFTSNNSKEIQEIQRLISDIKENFKNATNVKDQPELLCKQKGMLLSQMLTKLEDNVFQRSCLTDDNEAIQDERIHKSTASIVGESEHLQQAHSELYHGASKLHCTEESVSKGQVEKLKFHIQDKNIQFKHFMEQVSMLKDCIKQNETRNKELEILCSQKQEIISKMESDLETKTLEVAQSENENEMVCKDYHYFENFIHKLTEENETLKQKLSEKCISRNETEATLADSKEKSKIIEQLNSQLFLLEKKLKEEITKNSQLDALCSQKEDIISKLESDLETKTLELAQLDNENDMVCNHYQCFKLSIHKLTEENETLKQQLSEKCILRKETEATLADSEEKRKIIDQLNSHLFLLEKKLKERNAKNSQLDALCSQKQEIISKLESDLDTKTLEVAQIDNENERMCEDYKHLTNCIHKLTEENETLEQKLSEKCISRNEVEATLADGEKKSKVIEQLNSQLFLLEKTLNEEITKNSQLDALCSQKQEIISKMESDLETKILEVAQLDNENEMVCKDYHYFENFIHKLTEENETLKQKLSEKCILRNETEATLADSEEKSKIIEQLNSRLFFLEKKLKKEITKNCQLDALCSQKEDIISKLESDLETKTLELAQLDNENDMVCNHYQCFKLSIHKLTEENETLKQQLSEKCILRKETEATLADSEEKWKIIDQLNSHLFLLEKKLKERNAKNSQLDVLCSQKQEIISKLESDLDAKTLEVAQIDNENEKMCKDYKHLTNLIHKLTEENETLEQKLSEKCISRNEVEAKLAVGEKKTKVIEQLNSQLFLLEKTLNEEITKNSQLDALCSQKQEIISKMGSELETKTLEVAQLDNENEMVCKDYHYFENFIHKLTEEKETLKQKLSEKCISRNETEATLADSEEKNKIIEQLNSQLFLLEKELKEEITKNSQLDALCSRKQDIISKLESDLETKTLEVAQMDNKNEMIGKEYQYFKKLVDKLTEENEYMGKKMSALLVEAAEDRETMKTILIDNEEKTKLMEQLHSQVILLKENLKQEEIKILKCQELSNEGITKKQDQSVDSFCRDCISLRNLVHNLEKEKMCLLNDSEKKCADEKENMIKLEDKLSKYISDIDIISKQKSKLQNYNLQLQKKYRETLNKCEKLQNMCRSEYVDDPSAKCLVGRTSIGTNTDFTHEGNCKCEDFDEIKKKLKLEVVNGNFKISKLECDNEEQKIWIKTLERDLSSSKSKIKVLENKLLQNQNWKPECETESLHKQTHNKSMQTDPGHMLLMSGSGIVTEYLADSYRMEARHFKHKCEMLKKVCQHRAKKISELKSKIAKCSNCLKDDNCSSSNSLPLYEESAECWERYEYQFRDANKENVLMQPDTDAPKRWERNSSVKNDSCASSSTMRTLDRPEKSKFPNS